MKDAIEEAQQRETDAKNGVRELEAKVDKLEGERTTLLSRINVVGAEFERISERLDESNDQLDDALARSEQSEVRRKQLADTEVDDFERTSELENLVKAASVRRETAEHLVVEGERKLLILERDLARAHEKYENFAERIEGLSERVSDTSKSIKELEKKDESASEREDLKEEEVKFLETQLQQSLAKSEASERDVGKLERLKDVLTHEISKEKGKLADIQHQMEDAMGDILDDA